MAVIAFPQSEKTGYIPVEVGKIWYKILGEDKPCTPLLSLHGGPGAPHDYMKPLEKLAGERTLIFYEQLGCGNSDQPEDTSLWRVLPFTITCGDQASSRQRERSRTLTGG